MENGEKAFTSEPIEERTKIPEEVEQIKIRFSVFFDGTNNPRKSVERMDL